MTVPPETNPFHETAVTRSAVVQADEDGIVHLLMIPGHRTDEQVQETMAVLESMTGDGHILLLIEVLPLATMSLNAFDTVARSPFLRQINAVAFAGDPRDTDLIRPTLARVQSAYRTVAFFASTAEARAWLLGHNT